MRWKRKPDSNTGDKRFIKKFAFLPIKGDTHWYWLEFVYLQQTYSYKEFAIFSWYGWQTREVNPSKETYQAKLNNIINK